MNLRERFRKAQNFLARALYFYLYEAGLAGIFIFMIEIQTRDKYNKNRKTSLRIPLLHRSCLNVDINTKSTVLKLNRKLNPAMLTAPGSFRCPARDIAHYYLESCLASTLPPWCFFFHSCPCHSTGSSGSSPSFLDPVSFLLLNYLIYPHCISRPCFAVSLSFCGYVILHYGQYNKSILIDSVCFFCFFGFFKIFYLLFIYYFYFWLCWVFVSV